jgi:hypothetical protein
VEQIGFSSLKLLLMLKTGRMSWWNASELDERRDAATAS